MIEQGASNRRYLSVTKEGRFRLRTRDGDKFYTKLIGEIMDVFHKQDEYEGTINDVLVVILNDGHEEYYVSMGMRTSHAVSLVNTLASIQNPEGDFELYVYLKDDYIRIGASLNNERLGWAYDINTVPKPEEIKDRNGNPIMKAGKKMYDDSERFDWTLSVIGHIRARLRAAGRGNLYQTKSAESSHTEDIPSEYNGAGELARMQKAVDHAKPANPYSPPQKQAHAGAGQRRAANPVSTPPKIEVPIEAYDDDLPF